MDAFFRALIFGTLQTKTRLQDQIHVSGASGNATGRNIHQKCLREAIRMCNAIYAITADEKTVDEAMKINTEL